LLLLCCPATTSTRHSLPLGREPALRAIGAVSACDDPASADDDMLGALKRGLATLTVTKCEAARLTPVMETVSDGWESGDARLTEQHLLYIEHWDTISFEIIRAHKTGEWNGPFMELLRKKANIHRPQQERGARRAQCGCHQSYLGSDSIGARSQCLTDLAIDLEFLTFALFSE
jgi:hypothetical protein